MKEMNYAQALSQGLVECLEADERVVMIGAGYGGLTLMENTCFSKSRHSHLLHAIVKLFTVGDGTNIHPTSWLRPAP